MLAHSETKNKPMEDYILGNGQGLTDRE